LPSIWIARSIDDRVRFAAQKFPVVVLTGARQVGETELLRKVFPTHNYVSLDLPSVAANASNDPASFFAQCPTPALIDEVQYAPELFRHLKSAVDAQRQRAGQFMRVPIPKRKTEHRLPNKHEKRDHGNDYRRPDSRFAPSHESWDASVLCLGDE
jgi:hypothetical protein